MRFRQGFGHQLFDVSLFPVFGHGYFADQQVPGSFQHFLFAEGKWLGLSEKEKTFQYGGNFHERPGSHLVGILFEPVFPISIVAAFAVGQKV